MASKYQRCSPGDCCKDAPYGKPADVASDKGKQITPTSAATCAAATTKAGQSCRCAYLLHYSHYTKDGNALKGRNDTGWEVTEEKIHGYDSGTWGANYDKWSDADDAKLKADQKALDAASDRIRLELVCLSIDGSGNPIAVKIS